MRHRPFSRQRSATHLAAKILVDVWNCTVASWSQSVTSSTPFLGFFPANPFAVLIQPGSRCKVILQIFARVLFRESSSRFISVGRRPTQSEIPASFNCRLVMNIHCSFRVTPQSAQPSHSGRVRRSILPWAFLLPGFPAIEPFDFPLQKINIRSWLSRRRGFLKFAIDASIPIAFQCRRSFSVLKDPMPGSNFLNRMMPLHLIRSRMNEQPA